MARTYIEWLRVPRTLAYESAQECFEQSGAAYYFEVTLGEATYYIPSENGTPISITETEAITPKLYEG